MSLEKKWYYVITKGMKFLVRKPQWLSSGKCQWTNRATDAKRFETMEEAEAYNEIEGKQFGKVGSMAFENSYVWASYDEEEKKLSFFRQWEPAEKAKTKENALRKFEKETIGDLKRARDEIDEAIITLNAIQAERETID